MSQAAVERTLGKLATDPEFRAQFFANPAAAAWEAGLLLSPGELEALAGLSPAAVTRFSQRLDPRIVRLCLAGGPGRGARRRPQPASADPSDAGPEVP